jgi:hypothetical protein
LPNGEEGYVKSEDLFAAEERTLIPPLKPKPQSGSSRRRAESTFQRTNLTEKPELEPSKE